MRCAQFQMRVRERLSKGQRFHKTGLRGIKAYASICWRVAHPP